MIDSPKQLGQVLFERLGLPTFRKGKTGWSTDRKVLQLLEDKHPIVRLIGQYRELTKLDNTYLSALPDLLGEDGRLHTTFNQTVAETGRLSSTNPNLQNIPVRTPLGREIRGAFVAEAGHRLVSCDYSQVELRILAHCSGEPALAEAFRRGEDVHRATAAEVFGMAPADVDRDTRDRAKAVNFGIVYGISDFGLSEQLNIPRADARAYIDTYLARYPRVRNFIDTTIAAAAQDGYVTTLLGRRRPIPELGGRTVQQRQLGERLAVNTVIQGSAADIIKAAMVRGPRGAGGAGPADAAHPPDPRRAAARGAGRGGRARVGARAPGDGVGLPARPAAGGGHGRGGDLAGRQVVTPEEAYRVLQVDPAACRPVIDAAFGVLREMCLRDDADDAPRRLAELTRAHRIATGGGV